MELPGEETGKPGRTARKNFRKTVTYDDGTDAETDE
jgi:hypothetical protein